MESKIRDHIEYLFVAAPRTPRAIELKEELISNLTDRYSDLLAQGETEEAAYAIAIAGIGDVDDLIQNLREQESWDPIEAQYHRQKSAVLVATAVGLFIGSAIFPILFGFLSSEFASGLLMALGFILMVLCIAVGVALLVYNARVKPQPVPMTYENAPAPYPAAPVEVAEEAVFRDEPRKQKSKISPLQKTIQSILWSAAVLVYLMIGLFFGGWSPGWLIFLLVPVLSNIVRLVFLLKEEEQ